MYIADVNTVGKIGFIASNYAKEYLGYIAYICLPILLYPLYKFNFSYIDDVLEKILSSIFLLLSSIVFQSLVIHNDLSGKIGDIIIEIIEPHIGVVGLWIFVLIGLFVSLIILFSIQGDRIYASLIKLKDKFSIDIKA